MGSLLRTEVVKYEGVEVTVESSTLLTEIQRVKLIKALRAAAGIEDDYTGAYAEVCVQTRQIKNLDLEFPHADDPIELHIAAYNDFLKLPFPFVDEWTVACRNVSQSPKAKPEGGDEKK